MQDLNDKINNGGATSAGQLDADEWNQIPSEIQNAIVSSGQALSGGDLSQLVKTIAQYGSVGTFFTGAGIADAYTANSVTPAIAPPSLKDGMIIRIIVPATNTGASTLNAFSLGVVDIKLTGGILDPIAGDLVLNEESEFIYRTIPANHFQLVNPKISGGLSGQLSVNALIHVQDQKATGIGGGNNVAGFQKRTLNTVLTNTIPGASLSANEITLPAGVYYLEASSQCYDVQRAQATIRNITDVIDILIGISTYSPTASPPSIPCPVSGTFTLVATKNIDINQYMQSVTVSGLGLACSSGNIEVYSDIKVWKVG